MSRLDGKRILLVEDEFIIGVATADMLSLLGATVVGPAGTVAEGVALAEHEPLDGAVLDMNMEGLPVDPVADVLRRRNVPFIFATGYGKSPARRNSGARIVDKPYNKIVLGTALAAAIAESG